MSDTFSPAPSAVVERRALRLPAVCAKTGLSRSSIYALEKDKKFPRRFRLSATASAWWSHQIDEWLAAKDPKAKNAQAQDANPKSDPNDVPIAPPPGWRPGPGRKRSKDLPVDQFVADLVTQLEKEGVRVPEQRRLKELARRFEKSITTRVARAVEQAVTAC